MLYIASQPSIAIFTPARTSVVSVLPLTVFMCANVVLLNLSLAYSSIICYQIIRILLTPLTAAINFSFYGSRLPLNAVLALIPACVGVGLVSYFDSFPRASTSTAPHSNSTKPTTAIGIIFAFSGVVCSSIYTVWISHYHSRLKMSSIQLLYNQVPFGALFLAFVSLFTDIFPVWSTVPFHQWCLLLLSGGCACMVNLSLFFIIGDAGPVSSTVVGHLKTCLIVGLGWAKSQKQVGRESILGIFLALLGIILYSRVMYRKGTK
jgi:solute carrier family 35 protein E3